MKNLCLIAITLFLSCTGYAQVVTCDPSLPVDDQAVTITFHADRGNQGLMNYAGDDVYAHTGVITDKSTSSSNWKYVKAAWTSNIAACKLTKNSANEYQLTLSPSIREFYGVPAGEKILKMAFVFRNGNASKTGRDVGGADIFTSVYEAGLTVSFLQPSDRFTFAAQDQPFNIEVNANNADSLILYLDGTRLKKIAKNTLDTSLEVTGHSLHQLITVASKADQIASDTAWFMVPAVTIDSTAPAGIKDGIQYPADDSAIFDIYAPNKSSVFLIGDFNNWLPDSTYQFKKDGDRFWLAVGGLTPSKEYAFQYIIDQNLRVADPYTDKVLDPDYDKYIPASVYPNLLAYPFNKTTGITGVIQPGKPAYVWENSGYVPPASKDLIIYELLIRDFVSTHDIKDVAGKLDYIQHLGINAIELMPFNEFEGDTSWGYNPSFYFAPDKFYGRDIDIKDFVQECHNRGIAVIMDIVLNHSYGQNPMVKMYFNPVTGKPSADNPWFNIDSPNTVYSWGYDFNHESPATKYFVDRVLEYWLTDYKLDGFRFDFTKGFTNTPGDGNFYDASRIAILERIYNKVKSVNPEAYMICEHFAPNSEETVLANYGMMLWGNSNYNYNEATMGYLANSDFSWVSSTSRGWTNPNLVGYMESHDEERLMYKNLTYGNSNPNYNIRDLATALKRMELAGSFFLTIPGPKMIWQFGELGYDISINYNGRVGVKPVKWEYWGNPDRQHLYLIWAKILDIRKKYAVFQTDDYTLSVGNDMAMKKIILRHPEEDAIIIGNFGLISGNAIPGFTKTGKWYELFSGDSLNIVKLDTSVTLEAGEYRIYASRKMESIVNGTKDFSLEQLYPYPNPVHSELFLFNDQPLEEVEIFSASGMKVMNVPRLGTGDPIEVSGLRDGLYLIRLKKGNKILTGKFVKK